MMKELPGEALFHDIDNGLQFSALLMFDAEDQYLVEITRLKAEIHVSLIPFQKTSQRVNDKYSDIRSSNRHEISE